MYFVLSFDRNNDPNGISVAVVGNDRTISAVSKPCAACFSGKSYLEERLKH